MCGGSRGGRWGGFRNVSTKGRMPWRRGCGKKACRIGRTLPRVGGEKGVRRVRVVSGITLMGLHRADDARTAGSDIKKHGTKTGGRTSISRKKVFFFVKRCWTVVCFERVPVDGTGGWGNSMSPQGVKLAVSLPNT